MTFKFVLPINELIDMITPAATIENLNIKKYKALLYGLNERKRNGFLYITIMD